MARYSAWRNRSHGIYISVRSFTKKHECIQGSIRFGVFAFFGIFWPIFSGEGGGRCIAWLENRKNQVRIARFAVCLPLTFEEYDSRLLSGHEYDRTHRTKKKTRKQTTMLVILVISLSSSLSIPCSIVLLSASRSAVELCEWWGGPRAGEPAEWAEMWVCVRTIRISVDVVTLVGLELRHYYLNACCKLKK